MQGVGRSPSDWSADRAIGHSDSVTQSPKALPGTQQISGVSTSSEISPTVYHKHPAICEKTIAPTKNLNNAHPRELPAMYLSRFSTDSSSLSKRLNIRTSRMSLSIFRIFRILKTRASFPIRLSLNQVGALKLAPSSKSLSCISRPGMHETTSIRNQDRTYDTAITQWLITISPPSSSNTVQNCTRMSKRNIISTAKSMYCRVRQDPQSFWRITSSKAKRNGVQNPAYKIPIHIMQVHPVALPESG
mmetsp:Transcript_51905/g.118328  ORF Transcript_51905/g.118328 Transcript_51905/m.118328 type:complete len:246 (-) Transcript_51905:666-1403(-)